LFQVPYGEGCDCKNAEFGCCPDDVTPAKAANFQGCGCQYEEFGKTNFPIVVMILDVNK
jgi:hypothetical protein